MKEILKITVSLGGRTVGTLQMTPERDRFTPHQTSVNYSGNPSLEDIISAGTGIRISRKRCIEIIEEIESVCKAELDVDKIVNLKQGRPAHSGGLLQTRRIDRDERLARLRNVARCSSLMLRFKFSTMLNMYSNVSNS